MIDIVLTSPSGGLGGTQHTLDTLISLVYSGNFPPYRHRQKKKSRAHHLKRPHRESMHLALKENPRTPWPAGTRCSAP